MIKIITTILPSYTGISPIPRPPLVFALWFTYSTVHGSGRETKNRESLASSHHHVNNIRWTEVDIGREGPTTKTMHWIIRLSSLPQFWTSDVSSKLPALASKKLAFKLSSFEYQPLPLPTSTLRPLTWWTQAFPIFAVLCFRVLYWMQTDEQKKEEAWEQGYENISLICCHW